MTDSPEIAHFLDISNDICPMTFVKTKLFLERLDVGAVLDVRLKGPEPLNNVPRSVRDHGHEILSLAPEDPAHPEADAPHRLVIRKTA
ncbi:MAG: sulfurtransferase TusA family protein [Rhodospirillales bacterium CG15_BIG_FIL_POST_REV_8_21_14_020_66_15]|nr:MAG: sulfurtransferase TusA family protein [Rhodospirillales bacterium CG15_BIG_FIL_POST_REV_8_21_14_020_66_15]